MWIFENLDFFFIFWFLDLITLNLQGYVKNITKKGCFISLSKVMDARILLCNLSDDFIDNPEKEFPVGKLLHAK